MRAPSLDDVIEDEERDEAELPDTSIPTLAELAQLAFESEFEHGEFDWTPNPAMREPTPEPVESDPPMPTEPAEPSEPAPEPSEPAPPDPQAAPGYFRLSDTIALRAGLALGKLVNATEFGKILLNIHCPIRRGRKQHSEQRKAVAA